MTEIVAFSRPAQTFSGDFYRYRRFSDSVFFALGDVTGKGLDAAVIMAMIQEVVDEHEVRIDGPSALCDLIYDLDSMLLSESAPNCFASMVLGRMTSGGQLDLINAGHCPPLIVDARGNCRSLPSNGPLVGLLPDMRWQVGQESLAHAETLCLYSDGVIEAPSPSDDDYGLERLEHALRRSAALPLSQLASALLDDVRLHGNSPTFADDLTLLLLRQPGRGSMADGAERRSGLDEDLRGSLGTEIDGAESLDLDLHRVGDGIALLDSNPGAGSQSHAVDQTQELA